jgi:proteasome accessory factor C
VAAVDGGGALMARSSSNFAPRLRRMLLMVPWLLEAGGSTVAELAARFGVSEDDVVRDLTLVMCCGVPPYGAEHMITVVLDDDGSVLAWKGPYFTRPMRLTPAEGFAVLAAGRALLAVPGADSGGPLASALSKLEAALGSGPSSGPEGAGPSVAVDLESPPLLDVVRAATDAGEQLAVEHYSAWRDEVTERVIDPYLVFTADGRWYVSAHDSRSGELRHFRIDRLASATATGMRIERPADAPTAPPEQVFSGADAVGVTLLLPASAAWVAEAYDPRSVEVLDDGRLRVELAVAGERWLERLLLRVGPEAVVEAPASMATVGATAAARLLARYTG